MARRPYARTCYPLHIAIRLKNKNLGITMWSRISACPSDHNMTIVEAKHAVSYSHQNVSFIMIKIALSKVGLCTIATGNLDKRNKCVK